MWRKDTEPPTLGYRLDVSNALKGNQGKLDVLHIQGVFTERSLRGQDGFTYSSSQWEQELNQSTGSDHLTQRGSALSCFMPSTLAKPQICPSPQSHLPAARNDTSFLQH